MVQFFNKPWDGKPLQGHSVLLLGLGELQGSLCKGERTFKCVPPARDAACCPEVTGGLQGHCWHLKASNGLGYVISDTGHHSVKAARPIELKLTDLKADQELHNLLQSAFK